jgi:UDP-glucose 4-epimerase
MTSFGAVTGQPFEPTVNPRRPGDPARIVAAGDLAARDLDWKLRHSIDDMVASAWNAAPHRRSRRSQPVVSQTAKPSLRQAPSLTE